jgi:hypothetical protein
MPLFCLVITEQEKASTSYVMLMLRIVCCSSQSVREVEFPICRMIRLYVFQESSETDLFKSGKESADGWSNHAAFAATIKIARMIEYQVAPWGF